MQNTFKKILEKINIFLHQEGWLNWLSFFYALCGTFGLIKREGSENAEITIKHILIWALCWLMYFTISKLVIIILIKAATLNQRQTDTDKRNGFLISFILNLLVCIPMMIFFFPGMIESDVIIQMMHFRGYANWDGYFPVIPTWIYGSIFRLGEEILGSDNIGVFFFCALQVLIQNFIFAYAYHVICKFDIPKSLKLFALLFYPLNSIFRCYGYTMGKDTSYSFFILLLVIVLMEINIEEKNLGRKAFLFLIAGMGIWLFRNNGFLVVLLSGLAAFFGIKKNEIKKRRTIMLFLVGGIGAMLISKVFMQVYQIEKGPVREILSIPFQQTAKSIKDYPEKMDEEERTVLLSLFEVDDIEELGIYYRSEISDPVKEKFLYNPTSEELKKYLRIWWKGLKKYPKSYVTAVVFQIYGYFDPLREDFCEGIGVYDKSEIMYWEDIKIDFHYIPSFQAIREIIKSFDKWLSRLPIVGLFTKCGIYTFFLIFEVIYLIHKRRIRDLYLLVPCILTLLICLISPVDALIRYMLPVMETAPLTLIWSLYGGKVKEE